MATDYNRELPGLDETGVQYCTDSRDPVALSFLCNTSDSERERTLRGRRSPFGYRPFPLPHFQADLITEMWLRPRVQASNASSITNSERRSADTVRDTTELSDKKLLEKDLYDNETLEIWLG
jgi:hypothetical protein